MEPRIPLGWVVIIALAAALFAQSPVVSPMYTLSIERLDYPVADQQTVFNTLVPARTNFVMVFRNGLLETAGASNDYTTAPITGHLTVTFNQGLLAGDKVTLVYWR